MALSSSITPSPSKKGQLRCHMQRGGTSDAEPGKQMAGGAALSFPRRAASGARQRARQQWPDLSRRGEERDGAQ